MEETKTQAYNTSFRDRDSFYELGIIINALKETDDRYALDHYSQMKIILDNGGYRNINKIAKGGSGIVVSASKGNQQFALKSTVKSPYNSNKQTPWQVLSEEASILEFLHKKQVPNLVNLHGLTLAFFDQFTGGFLELELCGGSAFDRNVYSTPKLVTHTLKTLESLSYMHELGLVHGDIKPSNILVNPSGDLRLIDLATARKPLEEYSYSIFSKGFLAPELFYTSMRTESGDVFSLAATIFEGVSGKGIRKNINPNQAFNPYNLYLSLRNPIARVSDKLEYAITSGLQSSNRPNLNEFRELLLRVPEARDYTLVS